MDSDALILGLSNPEDDETPMIAVSNGSACSSASIEPSHVLLAMGMEMKEAFNCVRFSLGKFNNKNEIIEAIDGFSKAVEKLRALS